MNERLRRAALSFSEAFRSADLVAALPQVPIARVRRVLAHLEQEGRLLKEGQRVGYGGGRLETTADGLEVGAGLGLSARPRELVIEVDTRRCNSRRVR